MCRKHFERSSIRSRLKEGSGHPEQHIQSRTFSAFNLWAERTVGNAFETPSMFWISYVCLTHGYFIISRLFQKSECLKSQCGHVPYGGLTIQEPCAIKVTWPTLSPLTQPLILLWRSPQPALTPFIPSLTFVLSTHSHSHLTSNSLTLS